MGLYNGSHADIIRDKGGAVRVTLADSVGQGNDGTSLPCAGCYVQAQRANTGIVYMNIGAAASANLGIELAKNETAANRAASSQPIFVRTSDVSNLYFYGTTGDKVDILYLRG